MKQERAMLVLISCLGLAACSPQYFERKDTVAFSTGDAVASNIAVQVPDPWPKGSQDPNIPMDPIKAQRAIERYRCQTRISSKATVGGSEMRLEETCPPPGAGGGDTSPLSPPLAPPSSPPGGY